MRDDLPPTGMSPSAAAYASPSPGSLEITSPTVASLLAAPTPTRLLLPVKIEAVPCALMDMSDQNIQSPVSMDAVALSVASETPSVKDDIPDDDSSVSHLDCSQVRCTWIMLFSLRCVLQHKYSG